MKNLLLILLSFFTITIQAQDSLTLWYKQAASTWEEALPVGNGHIGAMIFGKIQNELIQLNEGSLWSGGPNKLQKAQKKNKYLPQLREAILQNNYDTAVSLAKKMQGNYSASFLPMGDLQITQLFGIDSIPSAYRRSLELNSGISCTQYTVGGISYERRVFASNPDSVLVIHLSSSEAKKINVQIKLSSQLLVELENIGQSELTMNGKAPSVALPNHYNPIGVDPIQYSPHGSGSGMYFQTHLKVKSSDGIVSAMAQGIEVSGASEVSIYLTAATSFAGFNKKPDEGPDEQIIASNRLRRLNDLSYEQIRLKHLQDFSSLFNRVSISLQDSSEQKNKHATDERLRAYSNGENDPELEALYIQYGRYLLMSCSRQGGNPANRQGIWNKELRPPWSSNYTSNINIEMNYWPAELGNLSESHQPLLAFMKPLSINGAKTAKDYYNTKGWVLHHNTDIWAITNPVGQGEGNPAEANWQMAGAWMCRDLWEHYLFTGDKEYLKNEAYPTMKGSAQFCLNWLVEHNNYLVTIPSTSPENKYMVDGKEYALSLASTMDMSIIRELFSQVIEASEILDIEPSFRKKLQDAQSKLYPFKIGSKGQLLEWSAELEEMDPKHPYLSHLYSLFPGSQISPITTPELAEAAKKSLELRENKGSGWSEAWKINLWARLLDGNQAHLVLKNLLRYNDTNTTTAGTYTNLLNASPPFQVDGNLGASSGAMEMLLQSKSTEVHLLPALPDSWASGSVSGLKARGNFEITMHWKEGKLSTGTIKSILGNQCTLRTEEAIEIEGISSNSIKTGNYYLTTFKTQINGIYRIRSI